MWKQTLEVAWFGSTLNAHRLTQTGFLILAIGKLNYNSVPNLTFPSLNHINYTSNMKNATANVKNRVK